MLKVIVNPPYKGEFHLEILHKIETECIDSIIVNLSPILSLQIPEKKNTFNKLEYIDVIDKELARRLFQARNNTDLGIWYFNNGGYVNNSFRLLGIKNIAVAEKVFNKIKICSSFKDYIISGKPLKNYCIVYSHMNGLSGSSHNFVYKDNIAPDGSTYRDNVKNQHKNDFPRTHFEFNTYNEAENFKHYLKSDMFRYIERITQPGLIRILDYLPYLDDYSIEWTDDKLYKYFDLNENEINAIKSEINTIQC